MVKTMEELNIRKLENRDVDIVFKIENELIGKATKESISNFIFFDNVHLDTPANLSL